MYDYLIVGAGLFGCVCAHELTADGKKCLVIDKRDHIAGNVYTSEYEGINVHEYGAHIFHTSNGKVWEYVNRFAEFNNFINSPIADYHGERYNLPFNMNTFRQMWGVTEAEEAKKIIADQIKSLGIGEPKNLEEQALKMVGPDVYKKLVKGYTEKQWGRDCTELPSFIIKRLPLRFEYNNNYFNDIYQGIPVGGYTKIAEKLLEGSEVRLSTDYRDVKGKVEAKRIIYTGPVDEYFNYCLGRLKYRTLRFEKDYPDTEDYQGNAVVNYTAREVPYTRIIEHKHFEFKKGGKTVITREYPAEWKPGDEPFYPINDEENNSLYARYEELALKEQNVVFGGRLGKYKYYDMDKVIEAALEAVRKEREGYDQQ